MTTETYNGWTNWETWNVNLWLTNDEGSYAYLNDLAERARDACPDEDVQVNDLADLLRDEVPESGIVGDAVSWHRVDWRAIAEAALED